MAGLELLHIQSYGFTDMKARQSLTLPTLLEYRHARQTHYFEQNGQLDIVGALNAYPNESTTGFVLCRRGLSEFCLEFMASKLLSDFGLQGSTVSP
jgi:hypothetical protein